jgi:hypothetical protein
VTRHRLDITSLIAGVAFLGIAVLFLAGDLGSFADQAHFLWPGLLILIGLALLVSGPRSLARQHGAGDEIGAERGEDG